MKRLSWALVLIASVAHADAWDAALARAVVAKERALDSNAITDWETALQAFLEVDAERPNADVSYEIASAAVRLRADDLAFERFERALAQGLVDPAAKKARAFLAAHAQEMGRLSIVGPAGDAITVLGRARGRLPLTRPLVVFAGSVRVGHRGHEHTVSVPALGALTLDVTDPVTSSPPPPPAVEATRSSWPLGFGIGLFAASGITAIVATSMMSTHAGAIEDLCPPEKLDGARCYAAPADRHAAYDDHRSAYLTWRAIRIGSFVGMGVGALSALYGFHRRSPLIVASAEGFVLGMQGTF